MEQARLTNLPRTPRGRLRLVIPIAAAVMAVAASMAAPAFAEPDFPFNPSISITTNDATAGAHPTVKIKLQKPPNHCLDESLWFCVLSGPNGAAHIEQDFKKLVTTLPAGLAPDANAVPWAVCTFDPSLPAEPYSCPDESQVGVLTGTLSNCVDMIDPDTEPWALDCHVSLPPDVIGQVYMGVPGPGEQARLVILAGLALGGVRNVVRIDVGITISPEGRITAVADNMPSAAPAELPWDDTVSRLETQFHDVTILLWGDIGAGIGHPLLTNPTSCGQRQITGSAQGYAHNVKMAWEDDGQGGWQNPPRRLDFAYGDGTTVGGLAGDYPVSACNSLPYNPRFRAHFDTHAPNAAPSITTELDQADGEATTGAVSVVFPRGFQFNLANKNGQCADEQFAARSCPADSVIGSAWARSRLLPLWAPKVSGNVYLGETDLKGGKIKILANLANDWLPNGIDLAGQATVNQDGLLQADFNNIPEMPIRSFELTLGGGDQKALVKNPRTCGMKEIHATLTSHQGKIVDRSQQVYIPCQGDGSFDLDLSTRKAGGSPTIDLELDSPAPIASADFKLPGSLRVARCARLTRGRNYGTQAFTTDNGVEKASLKSFGCSNKGALNLTAVRDRAKVGQTALGATGARTRSSGGQPLGLAFDNLPDQTTKVSLELSNRDKLLRLPSRCKRALKFGADFYDVNGKQHQLTKSVRVRCAKKRKSAKTKRR